jgi:hypothetical protein
MDALGLPAMPTWSEGIRDYLRERQIAPAQIHA